MSLVATIKDAPRLVRRQTSMGLQSNVIERPTSPSSSSGHMRLVSACAALPPLPSASPDIDLRMRRQRSPSASHTGTGFRLRRPSPSYSRTSSPSPASSPLFAVPPNLASRSPLYSPRSPLGPAKDSPTGSYFPHVPSRPTSPSMLQHNSAKPLSVPHAARADAAPVVGSANLLEQYRPPHAAVAPSPSQPPAPSPAPLANSPRKHTRVQSYDLDRSPPPPKPAVVDIRVPSITIPSPLSKATADRMPDLSHRPPIETQSTRFAHTLSVHLPGYAPDEVTLTVARNEAIKIVADKWSAAADDKCHLEWLVSFAPRDALMTGIHASFANETLCVTVPRARPDSAFIASRPW